MYTDHEEYPYHDTEMIKEDLGFMNRTKNETPTKSNTKNNNNNATMNNNEHNTDKDRCTEETNSITITNETPKNISNPKAKGNETPSLRTRSKTSKNNEDKEAKNNDNDDETTRANLNSKIGTLLKNTPNLRHAQAFIVGAVATIATENRELKEALKKQTTTVTPNKPDLYHFKVPGPNAMPKPTQKKVPQRLTTVPLESLLNSSNQQQDRSDIQINQNNTVSIIDNTRTCENSTEGWNTVKIRTTQSKSPGMQTKTTPHKTAKDDISMNIEEE